MAAAGIGRALTANTDMQFIIGLGMFGAGSMALITIMIKSFSFDKTGELKIYRETPILIPDNEKQKTMGGNKPVFVASREPAKVEYKGNWYNFTPTQLNRAMNRFDLGDYRVSRDYLNISTALYPSLISIMTSPPLHYWHKDPADKRYYEWTEDGRKWVESKMRTMESTAPRPSPLHV